MDALKFADKAGNVEITITTRSIQNSLRRLKSRVGADAAMHYCDYRSSAEGTLQLAGVSPLPEGKEWAALPPVMFETCQYNITLHFTDIEGEPRIIHINKDVAEAFQWYAAGNGGFLMAALDFLNEPGIFRLQYAYKPKGLTERLAWIEFRVVSPKLDTKRDLMHMMSMINAEYENLVFKYLTKTFQSLNLSSSQSNEMIWLSIFKGVIDEYITALEFVTNRPNTRGERITYYDRVDKIKRWSPKMLNQYEEQKAAKTLDHYLFRHDEKQMTIDTKENRFVKYTVKQIGKKLVDVLGELQRNYQGQLLGEELDWLKSKGERLQNILHHRIWRQIGEFKGFRQESSVLQKRTGYSQIYRLWYILQSGLGFYEGSNEIGVRPIWELYELWCFLKMKQLMIDVLEIDLTDPDQAALVEENLKTMLTPFTDSTVEHKITYHNRFNDDIVELCYQHTYNRRSGEVHTATTEQRPDIALNIQKADGFVLTYLYDAKYRVLDDSNKDIDNLEDDYDISDYPPPDALNQMHRYRDAIYYGSNHFKHTAKEIIGGYILFPGRYRKENGSESPYYIKSIKEVNIGAFPLLPNGEHPEEEGKMLRDHLVQILRTEERYEQIKDSIPQKGLTYTIVPDESNLVLVGYYKNGQLEPIKKNKLYYVRAGMEQGSLRLTAGFEHCHYVLLHNKQSQELYKLTTNGPRIVSGRQLQAKGFDVQREFYLVFDLESTEPIIYVHKPDGSTFKVKQSKTPYAKDPYFKTLTELLEEVKLEPKSEVKPFGDV